MKKFSKYFLLALVMIFSVSSFIAADVKDVFASSSPFKYDYDEINTNMTSITEYFAGMSDNEVDYYINNYVGMNKDAFESYRALKDEGIGSYESIEDCKIKETKNSIVVKSIAEFSKGKVEVKVEFQQISDDVIPVSIEFAKASTNSGGNGLAAKMEKAGLNTLMGMGTVFVVLIFLSFVISLFAFIAVFEKRKSNKNSKKDVDVQSNDSQEENEEELVDDLELAAVITAAIAASENTSSDGFVVRSIKRAAHSKWKNA